MSILVIQHRVSDFQAWKKAFDSDSLGRGQNGVIRHAIFRSVDDTNEVIVQLEFATREQLDKFLPKLRELWRRVGDKVGFGDAERVQTRIVEEIERVDYAQASGVES